MEWTLFLNNGTLVCQKWTIPDDGGGHHRNMSDFVFTLRNDLFDIRKQLTALKSPAGQGCVLNDYLQFIIWVPFACGCRQKHILVTPGSGNHHLGTRISHQKAVVLEILTWCLWIDCMQWAWWPALSICCQGLHKKFLQILNSLLYWNACRKLVRSYSDSTV